MVTTSEGMIDPTPQATPSLTVLTDIRPNPEVPDPRFHYYRVQQSQLGSQHAEVLPIHPPGGAIPSPDSARVTLLENGVERSLWRLTPLREPIPRGDLYFPEHSGHSTASMPLSLRRTYLNSRYYQAAGDPGAPLDPAYQFSVLLGLRDDGFQTVSRIDVKVTDTEVSLLQHVRFAFGSGVAQAEQHSFANRVSAAVRDILDDKLDIVEVRGVEQVRRRLRAAVRFDHGALAPEDYAKIVPVAVYSGSGRENASKLFLTSCQRTIAHEMAHRIFAAEDEYYDAESKRLAPERKVAQFDVADEIVAETRPSLMQRPSTGSLYPRHALAVAGLLRSALAHPEPSTKFAVTFAPGEQPPEVLSPLALDRKRLERAVSEGSARIADKLHEVGWRDERGDLWSPTPRSMMFRRGIVNYVGARDAIAHIGADEATRQELLLGLSNRILIHYLAEQIGYDRFRAIVIPRDGQHVLSRAHAFQDQVIQDLAEALSATQTDEGRAQSRRVGGLHKALVLALGLFDVSPRQAIEAIVAAHGTTEASAAAIKALREAAAAEAKLLLSLHSQL